MNKRFCAFDADRIAAHFGCLLHSLKLNHTKVAQPLRTSRMLRLPAYSDRLPSLGALISFLFYADAENKSQVDLLSLLLYINVSG